MVVDPGLFPVENPDWLIVLRAIQEGKITLLCHQVRIIRSERLPEIKMKGYHLWNLSNGSCLFLKL